MLGAYGVLAHLQPAQAAFLTGRSFFPKLIAVPFGHGLHEALDFALVACLIAAAASAMLGKQYFYQEPANPAAAELTDDDFALVSADGNGHHRGYDGEPVIPARTSGSARPPIDA